MCDLTHLSNMKTRVYKSQYALQCFIITNGIYVLS